MNEWMDGLIDEGRKGKGWNKKLGINRDARGGGGWTVRE